jgi:hypothetical protein
MNRRDIMCTAIAAAFLARTASRAGAANMTSAADFLRGVYQREIERHNKQLPADNGGFHRLFTRQMQDLMDAPRVPNPKVVIGQIRHALFGNGALPGREVLLGEVTTLREDSGSATVRIALTVLGNPRNVMVAMLRQGGAWRISDIDYGDGETLGAQYRRMTGR